MGGARAGSTAALVVTTWVWLVGRNPGHNQGLGGDWWVDAGAVSLQGEYRNRRSRGEGEGVGRHRLPGLTCRG